MAIATLHLCSRNIGRTMQPKISQSKISLSPSSLSVLSFSHSPSLWCPTLACASLSNQIKHCKLESRGATIVALDMGNYKRKFSQEVIHPSQVKEQSKDAFSKKVDGKVQKAWHPRDEESNNSEPPSKKQKLEGETGGQLLDQASTQQEWKDGVTVATGDLSVNVGLEIKEDGEYVMKIKRIIQSSTHDGSEEDEVERAKKTAQNAALLLLHAGMLQEMGEKLLDQSRASLRSMFKKSDS